MILWCGTQFVLAAGGGASPLPSADLPWLDPEETAALLAELEEAGLAPTDFDLAGLVRPPAPEVPDSRSRKAWSCQVQTADDGRSRAALDGRAGPVALRLRMKRGLEVPLQVGGSVWLDGSRLAIGAGGVSVLHGLGLLAAGPGRSRTASISGSLLPGESGPRQWSSADAATGVRGVVAELRAGPLTAGVLAGRRQPSTADASTDDRAAWVALHRDGLSVSALISPGQTERGRSFALAASRGELELRAETTVWRADAGSAAATAVALRWRRRGLALETLAAMAAAPAGPRSGCRPACLIGWDGQGWAARGRLALGKALTGTVLAAVAEDRPGRTTARDRDVRHTIEAGVNGRTPAGGTWALRWRRREDLRWVHDPATPWRPAAQEATEATDTYVAEAMVPLPGSQLAGAIRSVARGGGTAGGRRTVGSLVWRGPWGPLRATAGGSWAWGDGATVATVTTPVAGLAVPRSWSQWSAEVHAGADLAFASWRVQAALARRTSALLPSGPAAWEGWLRVLVSW